MKIKEDAAALSVREAQLKQEEERLRREKLEFERQRSGFDDERDRIGKLGLEVQKRSREIDELSSVSHCFTSVNCERGGGLCVNVTPVYVNAA